MIFWIAYALVMLALLVAPMLLYERDVRRRREREQWQAWRIPREPDAREQWRYDIRLRGRP